MNVKKIMTVIVKNLDASIYIFRKLNQTNFAVNLLE
jgi:hypothetical protein